MAAEAKEDRRIQKSLKLLNAALRSLLQYMKFKDITVVNICEEALIGRTTFYSHFSDKYDFLESWIAYFWPFEINSDSSFDDLAQPINQFFRENETLLINLFGDADFQVFEILTGFLCSTLGITDEKFIDGEINPQYTIASNHFILGMAGYILWQVKNKFPDDVPVINEDIFSVVKTFRKWEYENNTQGEDAMSKLTQLKKLQKNEDMGLAYLADEAYKLLRNPMILFDTDMKVLAYKENDTPFWNNFINEEMIKGDIIKSYIKNGSHEDIISPMRVVLFMYNEEINHNIIFGNIYDKNNLPIACLVVVSIYNPFEYTDLALVTSLCKMFSFEICKIPYYQNYSQTKLETYISKLITNGIGEKAYADGFVEMIYKGLKNRLYLAVADISQINPTFDRLAYYKELFMQTQSTFRYAIHSNYIVIT